MLRRLLENLQQRIERRGREHVHLVDDVHALFQHRRGIDRLLAQGADVVDAVVRRGVELRNIEQRPLVDPTAGLALVARLTVHRMQAVDRLGEDARAGRLARAARPREEIGVRGAPLLHLPAEGIGDVALADDLGKGFGPPLAVQRLVHGQSPLSLSACL